jgi:hypothetical protein
MTSLRKINLIFFQLKIHFTFFKVTITTLKGNIYFTHLRQNAYREERLRLFVRYIVFSSEVGNEPANIISNKSLNT